MNNSYRYVCVVVLKHQGESDAVRFSELYRCLESQVVFLLIVEAVNNCCWYLLWRLL